jgi:predicted permease
VLYREMAEQIVAVPGVRAINAVDIVPVTLSNKTFPMVQEGQVDPPWEQVRTLPMVYQNAVGPGHFETLAIPRLAGRDFTWRDTDGTPLVGIINETLARRFWPGESAIGKRIRAYSSNRDEPRPPFIEVVGVVKDSKYVTVGEEPRPFLYRPLAQEYTPRATLLARVEGDPAAFAAPIRQVLRRIDPDLPVFDTRPMSDATSVSLLPVRLAAAFLGVLGLLVLALAAIGLYGVLSFLVRLRTKEIGIRMALGADRPRVLRTIMGDALRWIAYGLGAGLALALVVTPLAASLLYGIAPRDWLTFLGVSLLLTAVGLAASAVPALRASRVDPLAALRTE